MQVIVMENPDDPARVAVMYPTGELPVDELVRRHVDTKKPYKVMDPAELPNEDNDFFEAWQLAEDRVSVNMGLAKEIHRKHLRAERTARFSALDVQFMRAVEQGDADAQREIAAKKQKLRDISKHGAIDAATTPAELRALTMDALVDM